MGYSNPFTQYNFNEQQYVQSISDRAKTKYQKAQPTLYNKTIQESFFSEEFGVSPNISRVAEKYKDVKKRIIPQPYLINGDGDDEHDPNYFELYGKDGQLLASGNYEETTIDSSFFGNVGVDKRDVGEVILGEGFETLDTGAFSSSEFTTITLPKSLKTINTGVFYECYSLKTINGGENVSHFGVQAFERTVNLESFTFPNVTESLPMYAFCGSGAKEITIPTHIKEIPYRFAENGLVNTLPNGWDFETISQDAFKQCKFTNIQFGNNLKVIGRDAFRYNTLLESIVISSEVKIDQGAFYYCNKLSLIECTASIAPNVADDAFLKVLSTGTLKIPKGTDYSDFLSKLPSGWKIEYVE